MHETLWDLRHIKEQREEIVREMEEIRLARSLGSKAGRLRNLVAGPFWELRSSGSSREGSGEVQRAGKACEETSPTTLA